MNQEESSIRSLKSVRRQFLKGAQGSNEILSSPMGRMAPTPSGFLHLGNIVNFLLTGIIAQKKASPVFLRIDDLDKDRCRDIYLEDIFHTLDFLNLPYFGPTSLGEFKKEYSQHNRIERYREVFEMIVDRERYFCTCSRREILERLGAKTSLQYDGYCRETGGDEREEGEMGAWRIKVTEHSELETKMGDFVLWQKNNLAPYQLASLVDDVDLGVTWLVRGEDLFLSSEAQKFLSRKIDCEEFQSFTNREFIHHRLIVGDQGEKISKSTQRQSQNSLIKDVGAKQLWGEIARVFKVNEKTSRFENLLEEVGENPFERLKHFFRN